MHTIACSQPPLREMGRRAHRIRMDLLDLAHVSSAFDEVRLAFGRIDILVNNAGIGPQEAAAEDWTEADFDATFGLNVKGLVFASQAVAQVMIEQVPTFIRTPGTAPALGDPTLAADPEERIAALHRIGEPADVAGAVAYLASPPPPL